MSTWWSLFSFIKNKTKNKQNKGELLSGTTEEQSAYRLKIASLTTDNATVTCGQESKASKLAFWSQKSKDGIVSLPCQS